jgi:hypothetical protein
MAWLPRTVKTDKTYTVEEVFRTLKREAKLPEPYTYQGPIGDPAIYIPGEGDNDIQVLVRKGKITITNGPRPKDVLKQIVRDTVLRKLGIPAFFHVSNDRLFIQTFRECTRLFGFYEWIETVEDLEPTGQGSAGPENEKERKKRENPMVRNAIGCFFWVGLCFFIVFGGLFFAWFTDWRLEDPDPTGYYVFGIPALISAIPLTRGIVAIVKQKRAFGKALRSIQKNQGAPKKK